MSAVGSGKESTFLAAEQTFLTHNTQNAFMVNPDALAV
jgi:hypothetical protein